MRRSLQNSHECTKELAGLLWTGLDVLILRLMYECLKRGDYPAWRLIGAVLRLMDHLEAVEPKPAGMSDEELEARVAEFADLA